MNLLQLKTPHYSQHNDAQRNTLDTHWLQSYFGCVKKESTPSARSVGSDSSPDWVLFHKPQLFCPNLNCCYRYNIKKCWQLPKFMYVRVTFSFARRLLSGSRWMSALRMPSGSMSATRWPRDCGNGGVEFRVCVFVFLIIGSSYFQTLSALLNLSKGAWQI